MTAWTPSKEKLPMNEQIVVAVHGKNDVALCAFYEDGDQWVELPTKRAVDGVTHWLSIPSLH